MATCPECGADSSRIDSRYRRRLIDLPARGRISEINVETRLFRCVGTDCRRRILSSASVSRSHCRQPAEHCGRMASCIASGSHWAGVPKIAWQGAWQSRSVKIPCLERFVGARSALTTGPSARDASTAPSSVISSVAASLHSCRIARVAPVPPDCATAWARCSKRAGASPMAAATCSIGHPIWAAAARCRPPMDQFAF
jgi:hypothetical protein